MDQIDELLTRGVDKIYPSKETFEKVLRSGKKIRLYQGFDPTGIQLHIGHLVGLMKLRQFQSLGHEVIFLIGDGTGQAGDPSGKTRSRDKFMTNIELRKNALDYVKQASKIIDFEGKNKAEVLYNGDWLNKLSIPEFLDLAGHFTLQQLEERDLYKERKKNGLDINLREFLYPLLQGYDSVAMNVDLEIGGTDQTFNMLCGRQLVKQYLNKEKFVLTTPLLTDASGKKIGKTEGNVIALTSPPNDLYGIIMSLPDDVITKSLTYITELALKEIQEIETKLAKGDNPMIHKKRLAYELVKTLNSKSDAKNAEQYFETIFQQKKSSSSDIPKLEISPKEVKITELLKITGLVNSNSEAKRIISQNAVDINGINVNDINQIIKPTNEMIIKVGKHRIIKLKT